MYIRPLGKDGDIDFCGDLVMQNWGPVAADRCQAQIVESFNDTPYSSVFCIADIGDPLSRDYASMPVGFAAYQPSMKMKGSFDFIWIAVHPMYKGFGVGKQLTEWRLDEIKKRGGQFVELVTQKPEFFSKFGFFKLHHLGNEWYLMIKLLTAHVDI